MEHFSQSVNFDSCHIIIHTSNPGYHSIPDLVYCHTFPITVLLACFCNDNFEDMDQLIHYWYVAFLINNANMCTLEPDWCDCSRTSATTSCIGVPQRPQHCRDLQNTHDSDTGMDTVTVQAWHFQPADPAVTPLSKHIQYHIHNTHTHISPSQNFIKHVYIEFHQNEQPAHRV